MKRKIKAIIFDLDGVLIDATEWHFEALNRALGVFGFSIDRDDHLKVYNGLPTSEKLRLMSEKQSLPFGLHDIIKGLKRKYTDEIIIQKSSPDHSKQLMLSYLKSRGYQLACCSNAQKYSVLNMLEGGQIDHFFELIIGNDEGYKPKPSPDIYLAAFKLLKVMPSEAVIIEDSPHGIEAAEASGANVVTVKGYEDVNLSLLEGVLEGRL